MYHRALLFVLESLDGGGKGTQIKLITDYLKEKDLKVAFFHFPMYGHNEFSKIIAAYLRGEYGDVDQVNPYFVANIYAMDRYLYFPEFKKLLNKNDVVLLDRYVFSNMAYQAAKYPNDLRESLNIEFWIESLEFKFLDLPYPDLTLFLDNSIDTIQKRLDTERTGDDRNYLNGHQDIHEKNIEFQRCVRQNYLRLIERFQKYEIVPCEDENGIVLSPDALFDTYKHRFDELVELNNLTIV